jgi:DNA-3-methyladenine glycosylase
MRERRGLHSAEALCAGPGKLCQALGISLDEHGIDLVTTNLVWIAPKESQSPVSISSRIGISRDRDRLWRFFETGSRFVSAHRRGIPIEFAGDTIRPEDR